MIKNSNKIGSLLGLVFFFGVAILLPQEGLAAASENIELHKEERDRVKQPNILAPSIGQMQKVIVDDREFLNSHDLTCAMSANWPPINMLDQNKKLTGLAIDYWNLISKHLNMDVDCDIKKSFYEVSQAIKDRQYDFSLATSITDKRRPYAVFSKPYISFPIAIATANDKTYLPDESGLTGKRVAVGRGYSAYQIISKSNPGIEFVQVDNTLAGLKLLAERKVFAVVDNLPVLTHLIKENNYSNIKISGTTSHNIELRLMIRSDYPQLAAIFNKGIDSISERERKRILSRWLTDDATKVSESIDSVVKETSRPYFIISSSIIALLMFAGLVILMVKLSRNESLSKNFGSVTFRRRIIIMQAVVVVVVIMIALGVLEYNRKKLVEARQIEIETVHKTTIERLHIWKDTQKFILREQATRAELEAIAEQLLAVQPHPGVLESSAALVAARKYDNKYLNVLGNQGFFIISPERINIGSMRDTNLGAVNLIEQQKPELLARAFQGETVFIPPIHTDVPLKYKSEIKVSVPTMFIATPIYNGQHKVIAVLAKRLDVAKTFSKVLEFGRYASSGESYAFDRHGRLLSETRFNANLEKIGLLEPGQHSALNIYIRNPGGNLLESYQPLIPRDEQPLTHMAASAVRGDSGWDMLSYRDYRGVPVIGVWQWNDEMDVGIATEIDLDEAYASYYAMRWTVFGLLGLMLIIATGGITFTLFLGEKASRAIRRTRDGLEAQVYERTSELELEVQERKQTEAMLQTSETEYRNILESLQDVYYRADIEGRFVRVSPSAQVVTGYSPDELIGQPATAFWRYPEKRQQMLEAMQAGSGVVDNWLIEGVHKDGRVIWGSINAHYFHDENGDIAGIEGTIRDVTAVKQKEIALQASEARMDFLLSSSPVVIYTCSPTPPFGATYITENVRHAMGFEPEQFTKNNDFWADNVHPDDRERVFNDLPKLFEHGIHQHEYRFRMNDGSYIWLHDEMRVISNEVGEPTELVGYWADITKSKQAELELKKFRNTLDQTLDCVFMFDADNLRFFYVNEGSLQQVGYSREELLKLHAYDIKPDISKAQFLELIAPLLEGKQKVLTFETVHQHKNGQRVPVEVFLQYMAPANEKPHFVAIVRNITERKALQQQMSRQKKLLDMLHQSTTSFVEKGDFRETMNDMLDTLLELTGSGYGFTGEVLYDDKGNPYLKTHAITNIAWSPETSALYEENAAKGFEFRNLDTLFGHVLTSRQPVMSNDPATDPRAGGLPEGHPAMHSFLGVPVLYGDELVGMYGIANRPGGYDEEIQTFLRPFDSTYGVLINSKRIVEEDQQNRKALVEAKESAESANLAKSQFLSGMSHELRTPLNAILGLAQLSEYDKGMTAGQKANAREIYKAGEHLLSLINEVLDLAKIESGHIELSMEAIDLSKVLDDCRVLIAPLAEASGISLDFESSQCSNRFVKADHTRFKQVLLNLMSNAIKYNRKNGYVNISCRTDNADSIRISIRDTGQGISENKLGKLFQAFNRLGAEFGEIEGTGIGLVITKQLVELMGGTLGVDSIVGKGSTFWVELKLTQAIEMGRADDVIENTSSPSDELETISSSAHILIAEDNVANQAVLQQQMELLGLHADISENGIKAWERLQNGKYDLLLTDIQMPLMDGYELVGRIRKAEQETDEHMPIIALTANAMSDDEKRCLENGMDDFITKPVRLDKLQSVLKKWLPEQKSNKTEPSIAVHACAVVEDEVNSNIKSSVDIAMLKELVGDDRDKHCLLFKSFINSASEIIPEMQSAYQGHASEKINHLAHKLKSSARSMGAHELADVCQALETAGKADNWDEIDSLIPRLDGLFENVCVYMKDYSVQTDDMPDR